MDRLPDCDKPTPLVQPSVESSSNASASYYEIMMSSRDKDHDVNAGRYYRLPADSYAAIDMGKPEVTPAMHAVISGPTSARTGGETRSSRFGENMTTPSMQLRMDLEAMESELIQESTQASNDGALLHLGEQTTTPIAQAMLGTAVVELIPISSTVSNDEDMQQQVCDTLRRDDGRGTAGTS